MASLDMLDAEINEASRESFSPSQSTPKIAAAGPLQESLSPSQANSAYSSAAGTPHVRSVSIPASKKIKQSAYAEGRPLKYSASGKVLGKDTFDNECIY